METCPNCGLVPRSNKHYEVCRFINHSINNEFLHHHLNKMCLIEKCQILQQPADNVNYSLNVMQTTYCMLELIFVNVVQMLLPKLQKVNIACIFISKLSFERIVHVTHYFNHRIKQIC